jgi:beta-lactamase class A
MDLPPRRIARLAQRALFAVLLVPLLLSACGPVGRPAPLAPATAPLTTPVVDVPAPPATADEAPAPPAPADEAPAPADETTAPAPQTENAAPSPAPSRGLQAVLDEVGARQSGRLGVMVKHLETGETATLNGRSQFRAASLYKLFVLHAAFARMQAGALARDEMLRFGEAALAKEPYSEWPAGTRTSVDCALEAMITVSHNAASAMLIDRLGGEERITDEMWQLGFDWTVITDERAYTSPADVARLLELIWRREAVSPEASEAMLSLLSEQQGNDRLPLPLPPEVAVAHKTGELPKLRHDAGIVFAPSGPYVLVAMAQDAPSEAAARSAVVDVSRAVYAYFEKGKLAANRGLPPRLAQDVFQTPDGQGRLAPLADARAQTAPLAHAGVAVANGAAEAKLRDVAVPDLIALQKAASAAGAGFWVTAGHRSPTASEASKATPTSVLKCRYELPPRKPAPAGTPAPARPAAPQDDAPPTASQYWLGTVVAVSDSPTGEHTVADYAPSPTGSWLLGHAWEYGFIPALPESARGALVGYEPWTLRWVGREMAADLHGQAAETNPKALAAELRRAAGDVAVPARPAALTR